MADIAASVLARLKNKSAKLGRSNQLSIQLLCQEEFLRRLQRSRYADNFILKGGLFLYALTDFESRATFDIDFLLQNIPNTPEALRSVLEEIITIQTGNDFFDFKISKIERISATKKRAGIGATVIVKIKNIRTTFGIDFGFGDVIVPKQEKRALPTQLDDFEAPVISTYSVESTIAEKLDAILSLMEYSSRMKDYYDIFYLSRIFNFDGKILRNAVAETFANRNRDFTIKQFDKILSLGDDEAMKMKWSAFLKKLRTSEVDFTDVLKTMEVFLRDVIEAVDSGSEFKKSWNAANGHWIT